MPAILRCLHHQATRASGRCHRCLFEEQLSVALALAAITRGRRACAGISVCAAARLLARRPCTGTFALQLMHSAGQRKLSTLTFGVVAPCYALHMVLPRTVLGIGTLTVQLHARWTSAPDAAQGLVDTSDCMPSSSIAIGFVPAAYDLQVPWILTACRSRSVPSQLIRFFNLEGRAVSPDNTS